MKELMQGLRDSSIKAILEADDIELLESLRVKYLGKKGELTGILRQMGKLSAEERPVMGQLANQLRGDIEAAIEQRKAELGSKLMELKLTSRCRARPARSGTSTRCTTSSTRSRTSS